MTITSSCTPHRPRRTCVGCGKKGEKDSFLRFVASREGVLELDVVQQREGRGMYLCPRKACFWRAAKKRRLAAPFKKVRLPECTEWIKGVENELSSWIRRFIDTLETRVVQSNGCLAPQESWDPSKDALLFVPLRPQSESICTKEEIPSLGPPLRCLCVPSAITNDTTLLVTDRTHRMKRLSRSLEMFLSLSAERGME